MMESQSLDLLIAYADDRAVFGPAHARWLADFPVHFESVCILIFPGRDPIMLVGPESDEYALLRGQIKDVRVLREFTHPDEEYPFSTIQSLAEIIAEVIPDAKLVRRIGVAAQGLMSADFLSSFRLGLPNAEWIDVETAMCNLRAIKSPAEIAVIRHAYGIAQKGFDAALETIRVGATEREVMAEIESAMRRAGAEGTGIDTIVASGPNSRPILGRSTFRKIQNNELVLLTIAPRYEGYHAAIGRPVLVGDVGAEIKQAVDAAVHAQEVSFAAMKPGVEGRVVEAVGRRVIEQAGLGEFFLYSGVHSIGVIEFEWPIFVPRSDTVIQPNRVISIDIPLFNTPWGGLRVEDGFLITESGAERINETPFLVTR
jgi:Xaa-Pro aminopeptidase